MARFLSDLSDRSRSRSDGPNASNGGACPTCPTKIRDVPWR